MVKGLIFSIFLPISCWASASFAADALPVRIDYLRQMIDRPPVLSNLDPYPDDAGIAGARLAIADNRTTGSFLGHDYALNETTVDIGDDVVAAAQAILAQSKLIVLDVAPEMATAIADLPEAADALLINATSGQNDLRGENCRGNLLHTIPSDAMRADALMQFFMARRWSDLVMIRGNYPADIAFADALTAAATKFGMTIRAQKTWVFDADMRRNASQEVPLFTQDFGDYDALIVVDEIGDFARYIPYNTWEARPVAGSEGLKPVAWAPVMEQWGAVQLQNRFDDLAQRQMRGEDYGAWAAVRAIGEAVTRTSSNDAGVLRAFILSPDFELAGFKGRVQSFRPWDGQMRQPIALVTDRAVVTQAPLEGFLHQRTELDTLGADQGDSKCSQFN